MSKQPRLNDLHQVRAFLCDDNHVSFTRDAACCWKRQDGRSFCQYAHREVFLRVYAEVIPKRVDLASPEPEHYKSTCEKRPSCSCGVECDEYTKHIDWVGILASE